MLMLLALELATASALAKQTAFACRVGDRTAVVVRSGDTLTYRSLRRGLLVLQVTHGTHSRTGYSGGGELQAVFRNRQWTYVVYQSTIRTGFAGSGNDPRSQAGGDVLRDGRVLTRRRCDNAESQFNDRALADLPGGEFVEH